MAFDANTCLIIICTLCFHPEVQGQILSDTLRTEDIQEVTVTASRDIKSNAITTAQTAGKELMHATGTLQVSDVLKFMSGAAVKDYGGIGGLKTVSVRGLGASHTAVAYDGIIITDNQTGQIDLGKFSSSQAESVRMVSGPDNDMLQPAALAAQAAVISMNTGQMELYDRTARGNTQVKYGSFNTVSAIGEAGFKAGARNTATVQMEWLKTRGNYPYTQMNGVSSRTMLRDNSDVERLRTEAALQTLINDNISISTRAYWFQSEQGLPANILYNENAARERLWNRNGFMQSSLRADVSDRLSLRILAKYGVTWTRYLDPRVSNTAGRTDNRYTEQEGYLGAVALYRIAEKLSASVGIDGRLSGLDGNGAEQARPTRYTLNSTAALKYASERITVTGRLNHVLTHEETALRQAADSYNHLSPAAGLNWLAWPAAGLHIRASFSNTFRLPTFNDLYFEQVGRRELRPERAQVTSAGIITDMNFGFNHLSFYADAFNSSVRDRIMAVPGKNTAVWMMKNIGLVTTHGIETGVRLNRFIGHVRPTLLVSYTYQRTMDKTSSNSTTWNHQLPYIPRHSASAVAWIETPLVGYLSCNMIYSGRYYCNGYNGPEYEMPAYYELGCSAWRYFYIIGIPVIIKAECINLTDQRYELVRNYPMPGRQLRVSIKIEL